MVISGFSRFAIRVSAVSPRTPFLTIKTGFAAGLPLRINNLSPVGTPTYRMWSGGRGGRSSVDCLRVSRESRRPDATLARSHGAASRSAPPPAL